MLQKICRVCNDEVKRLARYKKLGLDPYDIGSVIKEITESFVKMNKSLEKETKKRGIDLSNLPEVVDDDPEPDTYPMFRVVEKYGNHIAKIVLILAKVAEKHPKVMFLKMAVDVLAHSRGYIISKTGRALSSRREEMMDKNLQTNSDAKISTFFAYVAIKRNTLALVAFSYFLKTMGISDLEFRQDILKEADISYDVSELLRQEFFPKEQLTYNEIGCEEYEAVFLRFIQNKSVMREIN